MGKKRIIKKFEQLPAELLALMKKEYPDGYEDNLISFQTITGELAMGLPLETEDTFYMIRMPKNSIPEDDDDDGGSGNSDNFESLDNLEIADDMSDDDS